MLARRLSHHRMAALLLCLLVAAGHVFARPRLPDTVPATVLSDWLAAFNSADLARIKHFNEAYSQSDSADDTLAWRTDTGGYAIARIEASQPTRLVALLRDKRDDDEQVRVTV